MTVEEIVLATRNWPAEQVSELVERLTQELHQMEPNAEKNWRAVIVRRLEDMITGRVCGVSMDQVMANAHRADGR